MTFRGVIKYKNHNNRRFNELPKEGNLHQKRIFHRYMIKYIGGKHAD